MSKEKNVRLEAYITRKDLDELFGNPYYQVTDKGKYIHGGIWNCYQVWNVDGAYWEFDWWEDHCKGDISINHNSSHLLRRVKPVQKLIWENYVP